MVALASLEPGWEMNAQGYELLWNSATAHRYYLNMVDPEIAQEDILKVLKVNTR